MLLTYLNTQGDDCIQLITGLEIQCTTYTFIFMIIIIKATVNGGMGLYRLRYVLPTTKYGYGSAFVCPLNLYAFAHIVMLHCIRYVAFLRIYNLIMVFSSTKLLASIMITTNAQTIEYVHESLRMSKHPAAL